MTISESLLPEFDQEMASTRKTLERVPDSKFSWKPHEKSSAMGQLAGHLANIPSWLSVTIKEDTLDLAPGGVPMQPPPTPKNNKELLAHFDKAARACAPLPFYLYEFEARSGYPIPLAVIERLRERAPNLAGMKVSDSPWERVEPFLVEGLDVFIGAEALLVQGLAAGAVGAVSGLAGSFPDAVVPLVRRPTPEAGERATALRRQLQRFPFHAASKAALGFRGVAVGLEVRPPLRELREEERTEVERIVREWEA